MNDQFGASEFVQLAAANLERLRPELQEQLRRMARLQRERDETVAIANKLAQACVALMVCMGKSEVEARKVVLEWRNMSCVA